MNLMRVRLELARTPEFPNGSARHGYEFVAPLTPDGHIDARGWKDVRDACSVVRFWGDDELKRGRLRHVGQGWRFDYDPSDDADDEPFFKLDKHRIGLGNYVSLSEHDGQQFTFRVAGIVPAVRSS